MYARRLYVIPPEYVDLDSYTPQSPESIKASDSVERSILVVMENNGEILGVTEHAFYLVYIHEDAYFSSPTLLNMVQSPHSTRSILVSRLISEMMSKARREKILLAVSMLSEHLPEYIVSHALTHGEFSLLESMLNHAREITSQEPCFEAEATLSLCEPVRILGEDCRVGFTENGEPCIATGDGTGVVLKKPLRSLTI